MNGDPVSRESLKNFYGYKETFGRDSIWVPVPQELTFITTNNPYDDEDGSINPSSAVDDNLIHNGMNFDTNQAASDGDFARQLAQAAYPGYATHGLEALSAVASQDQYNYAPPPAPMTSHDVATSLQHVPSPQQSHEAMVQSLDSLLNVHSNQPTVGSPPPNIDPQLGEMQQQMQQQQPHQQQHHQHQQQHQQNQQHQQHSQHQQHQPYDDQKPIHVRTSSYNPDRPPSLHSKGTTGSSPAIREPDLAFLMRDYSEHAAAWMDLFDLGQFFATEVPLLAIECPLLLYSCASLSAKSLSRITTSEIVSDIPGSSQRHSRLALRLGAPLNAEGWVQKGRENYDLAVSLLRRALVGGTTALESSALPDTAEEETASIAQDAPLPKTDSDELVAATAILCVYEFLDASGPEWSRHLDGAKSLFEVAKESMVPLSREPERVSLANQIRERLAGHTTETDATVRRGPSKGRTAVFWNFARQDMLSAFINNTGTRLDVGDLPMWTSAGINLDPQGYLCPSNPSHPEYRPETAMSDDKISNALIWLLMKLVNFIAAGDEMPASVLGVRQHDLLTYWHEMDKQLRVWHEGLPPSFRAIAVGTDEASGLEERWFPRPMCASAMQTYHFTRVQLLMNKPHISTGSPFSRRPPFVDPSNSGSSTGHGDTNSTPGSSLAARHASYASILQQCRFHAKEIVAISLGRADEGTRIHSVQPLWTAGLVLGARGEDGVSAETELWRRMVVDLLRGIERDMGWACEYRVQDLLSVWEAEGEESV
jgi:hypothetical protein